MTSEEYPVRFSPDGLTEQIIDVLLREVGGAGAGVTPQSGLAVTGGGQATRPRYRRQRRWCGAAVVCPLSVRGGIGGPDGWAA